MKNLDAQSRNALEPRSFAFALHRKEPIENASHVRNAIARFMQVEGVSDVERDVAWKRIRVAARRFHVVVHEASWRDLAGGGRHR